MSENERLAGDARSRLTGLLAKGLSNEPAAHARQVAEVAGILSEAFGASGFTVTRPLRDRVVGFKHWRHTAYGDQAIAMLIAFGDDLDMEWLDPELAREDALDAFEVPRDLARSETPVNHERLLALIEDLHARESHPAALPPPRPGRKAP